ncbi:hypothetical protein A2U01_0033152, partial [Trifolium medium]|nr:hypothetical protein [Trifolium medium]
LVFPSESRYSLPSELVLQSLKITSSQ